METYIFMAHIPHQSRSYASRQLTNKLKQLYKICIIGPELQKVTAHSTSDMTQISMSEKEAII